MDCPGHDILMATMLNGAAVMDAALLLIGQWEGRGREGGGRGKGREEGGGSAICPKIVCIHCVRLLCELHRSEGAIYIYTVLMGVAPFIIQPLLVLHTH